MNLRKRNVHSTIPVLLVIALLSLFGAQAANAQPAPAGPITEEPSPIPPGR